MVRTTSAWRRAIGATTTIAALMLTTCGDDSPPSQANKEPTTTIVETTSPPTTLTPEAAVEMAFQEWLAVMTELGPEPDPDDQRLTEMVLEPQLTEIRDSLSDAVATNQVYEISPQSGYDIISTTVDASGLTASLVVCNVGADKLIDRDTGDVISDEVSTTKNEVAFRQHNGRWMLEEFQTVDWWDGATTCEG